MSQSNFLLLWNSTIIWRVFFLSTPVGKNELNFVKNLYSYPVLFKILSFRFLEKRSFVRNERCQKQMSSKAILIMMSHLKFCPDRTRAALKNIFFNIYNTQNCFSRSNTILLAITPQKKIVDKFSSTLHTMKKVNNTRPRIMLLLKQKNKSRVF